MNEDIKAFDTCFKDKGGHLDYTLLNRPEIFSSILKDIRQIIEDIRATNQKLPEVYIDFINNSSLNAIVSKKDERYFIGINIGTYVTIADLFYRMLSSPKILPEFGDITKETYAPKLHNAQITDTDTLFNVISPGERHGPNDSTRQSLAQILIGHAFRFLVVHEYAHIIYGHLDYIGNEKKSFSWNEVPQETSTFQIDAIFSQTLEMDADCFGAKIGVERLIHRYENADHLNPSIKQFYFPLEKGLTLWLFSTYSLFRLFGFHNTDISKIKTTSHPQSGIRQRMIFSTVATIFQTKTYKNILDKIGEIAVSSGIKVEEAFNEISHQGFDATAYRIAMEEQSREHMNMLMRNWNNVRPFLEKYAYANLAPLCKD